MNVEELKQRFPVQDVQPYGSCIVVPGTEFNPDWEGLLDEQGYRCFNIDLANKAVTLVCLKRDKGTMREEVYRPSARAPVRSDPKGPRWTEADEKRLLKRFNELAGRRDDKITALLSEFPGRTWHALRLKLTKLSKQVTDKSSNILSERIWSDSDKDLLVQLWTQKLKVKDIATKFPERSENAVRCCLDHLRKAGRIKGRWGKHASSTETEVATPTHETQDPTVSPEGAPAVVGLVTVVKVLREILSTLQKLNPDPPTVHFDCFCPTCKDPRDVEDANVWKCCPVCGGPLVVWNVEIVEVKADGD